MQSDNPSAAILVIGDEILSGRTHDKNIAQIASWLQVQGIRLSEVRVVPDVMERIVEAVNALREGNDYLFTTGGIGPTHDDIPSAAIAKAEDRQQFRDAMQNIGLECPVSRLVTNTKEAEAALKEIGLPLIIRPSFTLGGIGGGIAGEALLIFHDSEIDDVAKLLNTQRDEGAQLEMQLDLASIIIGACLNGLSEQLNITLSQGHPLVLGQHCPIEDLIRINQRRWKRTLAVEISYGLENLDIHFDLLLLFTEDSVPKLRERLDYLID